MEDVDDDNMEAGRLTRRLLRTTVIERRQFGESDHEFSCANESAKVVAMKMALNMWMGVGILIQTARVILKNLKLLNNVIV